MTPPAQPRELVASNSRHWSGPHWGLTPSFADAAFQFRSAPLHTFHSAVRKQRRQAGAQRQHSPGGVSTASSAPATMLMLARLGLHGAWPNSHRPQCQSAHRFEPPGRSAWLRALSPALPAETTRRLAPDGRMARPPRPDEGGVRLRAFSSGYDAPLCASGPALKSRRLSPRWF